jgi:hypothetical protein
MMVLALGGLIASTGCDPRMMMYFLQPFNPTIAAPGPSLKGKKVVVLSHATAAAQSEFLSIERELNREFVSLLRTNVKKITVVDPDKVQTWVEGHPDWTDPSDAARDFDADVAIFLELEEFQIQAPGDLNVLHGTSKIHVRAVELKYPENDRGKPLTDKEKEPEEIWDDYVETEFPKRGPVAMDSGVGRSQFKSRFLKIVANEVSWQFVEHPQEDIVEDARFK